MADIDQSKITYFLDGIKNDDLTDQAGEIVRSLIETQTLYSGATREIATKLENLNDEFRYVKDRNPIHQIKTRVKSPRSIMKKLKRLGAELSVESAKKNLYDIAGVRVICSYIEDIYLVAGSITSQDDVEVIRERDYIKNPKENGYRSLHLVVTIPVFWSDRTEIVTVEIQIRTIAMDFWASLEHDITYKFPDRKSDAVMEELKQCATIIAETDHRMQDLYNHIVNLPPKSGTPDREGGIEKSKRVF